jgi:hypothetical protein
MGKLGNAFNAFFAVLKGETAQQQETQNVKEPTVNTEQISSDAVCHILSLLQREGRLIDFLKEDITNFSDEQVGHAVREIHKNCNKMLSDYIVISPVISDKNEGDNLTLSADEYNPKKIKLLGNVPEEAPYTGRIQHKGWRIESINLPKRQTTDDERIIYQAECLID